jgi:hypothetical protein
MVVNVRRYTVPFFIDVDNATIRYTARRKYMPSDQPSNDHLEKIRHRIHGFIMEDARQITFFILPPEF